MYMFFWFFKQFYYCLRRIFKSGILLLLIFFIIFIFIITNFKNVSFGANATDIPSIVMNRSSSNNLGNRVILKSKSTNYYTVVYFVDTSNYNNVFRTNSFRYGGFTYKNYYNENKYYNNFIPMNMTTTDNKYAPNIYFDTYNSSSGTWSSRSSSFGNNTPYFNFSLDDYDIVWSKLPVVAYNYNALPNGYVLFNPYNDPIITNTDNSIISFTFDYLIINAYNLPSDANFSLEFKYPDRNHSYIGSIDNFKYTGTDNNLYFQIPRTWFLEDITLLSNSMIYFNLIATIGTNTYTFELPYYQLNIDSSVVEDNNNYNNSQNIKDINNKLDNVQSSIDSNTQAINNNTDAINNIDNTIKDSNVDNSSIFLPTDNSNDITADALNGIFTSIYNAFCTGQAQDIVFPIPFTDKNITLSPNYVYDMLSNNGATWVITIIQAFWWYLISRFIIKDIVNKITKIKSGNIEDIENSNIKGDML